MKRRVCKCGNTTDRISCISCIEELKYRDDRLLARVESITKCSTTPTLLRRSNPENLVVIKQEREKYYA